MIDSLTPYSYDGEEKIGYELLLLRCSHFGTRLKEPGDGHMENDFNLWLATMDRLKVHIALV